MQLSPASVLTARLKALSVAATPPSAAELGALRAQAQQANVLAAFDVSAQQLFPQQWKDLFEGPSSLAAKQGAAPETFVASTGGRGVGGTLSLLRPSVAAIGVATVLPLHELVELAKSGAPAPRGTLLLDTNLGDLESKVDASWRAATLDHHGPVHGAGKGRGTNSTTQLLDRFEAALTVDVAAVRNTPDFLAALSAVERVVREQGLVVSREQKEQVAAAVIKLELRAIASDNVGDGLSWPAWMATHQVSVLLDAQLRTTIRAATIHEDFGVFGSTYLGKDGDVGALPDAVKLQSALFVAYDEALQKAGVVGSDRVPSEKAAGIAAEIGAAIDALLASPELVARRSHDFFFQVGLALCTLEEHGLVQDASSTAMPVFDVSKMPPELGTFARWAVPPLFCEANLQMKTSPAREGRAMHIIAIPDGRSLPQAGDRGLLVVLDALNARERAQTPQGQTPATWFGRDTVLLPSQPGSCLAAKDVCDVLKDAGLLG